MDQAVQAYLAKDVAPSTLAVYNSAQRRFSAFCHQLGIMTLYPVNERLLCRFVAQLAEEHLKHRTIKAYLSGIRFFQIKDGLGDPFQHKAMPLLEYVMTGIKREQARGGEPPRLRLPITPDVLRILKTAWLQKGDHDGIMLWAAACTGFFGFLRAGEFTSPTSSYDPAVHLSLSDIAVDSHSHPTLVRLRIKQSKTDPFRQGTDVFLGATGQDICPLRAMANFLAIRSPAPDPLFVFGSGSPLSREILVSRVQSALAEAGLKHTAYKGHSFRIGVATTAAKQGFEDSLIKTLLEEHSLPGLH